MACIYTGTDTFKCHKIYTAGVCYNRNCRGKRSVFYYNKGYRNRNQSRGSATCFEKGYTGYNGHADKKATGIGLYLCRQMADKLGHTIRMESELGKGTKVWIGFDLDYADTRD